MKLIRIDHNVQPRYAIDRGDGRAELLADTPLPEPGSASGEVIEIEKRLAPIQPTNIFCIGLNYREHATETGAAIPDHPVIFMKPTSTVIGPGDSIQLPACQMDGPEVDSEAELGVVIGKPAKDVSETEALDYVLGYTCCNDISARRWQKQGGGGQWVRGKSFDTFCPMGPCLVTPDELGDPQDLAIKGTVGGQVMQDSRTSDMIFSIAELIAFLSRDTTLLPGTLILTGTPPGVGFVRKPPVYLGPGDEVVVEIEGVGQLRNPVVAAAQK
jgi:2-keto-4-pentenoate hydratase/2-oxohepta-3-ene-1,7-dioic acid hydratase in catechol pathway